MSISTFSPKQHKTNYNVSNNITNSLNIKINLPPPPPLQQYH